MYRHTDVIFSDFIYFQTAHSRGADGAVCYPRWEKHAPHMRTAPMYVESRLSSKGLCSLAVSGPSVAVHTLAVGLVHAGQKPDLTHR